MVIDDEPGMLAPVERIARAAGFEVDLHANGHHALRATVHAAGRPDVRTLRFDS